MATINGMFSFGDAEAQEQAEKMKNAMQGWGTSEDVIVEVLVSLNNDQRQTLAGTYSAAYGKDIIEDLQSELSGNLLEAVEALMLPPRDFDAKMLHDAMSGIGTREQTLIGVLCARSNEEIEQIKEAYKRKYETELVDDLKGDTSEYFERMMFSLVSAARQEGGADDERAEADAQKLIEAGVNTLGTEECDFNAVLCLSSYAHLRAVMEKYKELREGVTLEEDIESEMSSSLRDGYLAILKVAQDMYGFFAEQLHNAVDCAGTKDCELIRILVSRSEIDLTWVAEKYEQMYETSLYDAVKGDTSGSYARLLLSIIAGKYIADDL